MMSKWIPSRVPRWLLAIGVVWIAVAVLAAIAIGSQGDGTTATWFGLAAVVGPVALLGLWKTYDVDASGAADVQQRQILVIASGPELAGAMCRIVMGPRFLRTIPTWVSVRRGGIIVSKATIIGRNHVFLASEFLSVSPTTGIVGEWVVVDHTGVDSLTPLTIRVAPSSELGLALASIGPEGAGRT